MRFTSMLSAAVGLCILAVEATPIQPNPEKFLSECIDVYFDDAVLVGRCLKSPTSTTRVDSALDMTPRVLNMHSNLSWAQSGQEGNLASTCRGCQLIKSVMKCACDPYRLGRPNYGMIELHGHVGVVDGQLVWVDLVPRK